MPVFWEVLLDVGKMVIGRLQDLTTEIKYIIKGVNISCSWLFILLYLSQLESFVALKQDGKHKELLF